VDAAYVYLTPPFNAPNILADDVDQGVYAAVQGFLNQHHLCISTMDWGDIHRGPNFERAIIGSAARLIPSFIEYTRRYFCVAV
jgi:hypothetical protein